MSYTLPVDTHAPGDSGHTTDHNSLVDVVRGMGAVYNVLNTAYGSGGADPSGVLDSTAAIQAALNALPAGGGVVYIPPGIYKVSGTLTNNVTPTYIQGAGRWVTKINFTGTGDCIRMFNPVSGGGGFWGGGVTGLYVNGTSAGAGSTGLHIGDGEQYYLDVAVEHFNGAGSIGVHLDNTVWWTEKCHGTIWARDCTSHVVFDVSGATTSTNSFGYLDLTCYLYSQPNQDGVVVQNGAYPYHGSLVIKGNFQGSASAVSNAVLRVTGTVPAGHTGAGNGSAIGRCHLDIQTEVGSFANQPSTVIFGAALTNSIIGCYGIMDFTQGAGSFAGSNVVVSANASTFTFEGPLIGDSNLGGTFGAGGGMVTVGTKGYGKSFMSGSNGNVFAQYGDFFSATLSASITLSLTPSGVATNVQPQRKTIVIKQAAAGGPFTVTWPHAGSPTNTSPTVLWAGGTAPTMTAAANAVDVYKLETLDGITWYGQAIQNVS
jgi:Pectate lyase superfamily protein